MSTATLHRYREPAAPPPPHPRFTRPPLPAPGQVPRAELVTAGGSEVKHIDRGCSRLSGWAVRFGASCEQADPQGDIFDAGADYDLDDSGFRSGVSVYWGHRLERGRTRKRIGRATLTKRAEGIWADVELSKDIDPAFRLELAQKGRGAGLFFSSGTARHLMERSTKGGCRSIVSWPIVEVSLCENPVNRACTVDPASVKATAPNPALLARVRKLTAPAKVRPDPAFLESLRRQVEHTKAFLAESKAKQERELAEFEAWRAEQDRLDAEARLPGLLDRVRDLIDDAPTPGPTCDCGCGGGSGCKATLPDPYLPVDGLAFACWAALEETPHLDGLSFAKSCDFGPELEAGEPVIVPLLAYHDARRVIGVARLTRREGGLWMEALADADADAAKSLLVAGWGGPGEPVGVSTRCRSGADRGGEIHRWVPAEASILRTPADPALKALRPAAVARVDVMRRYRRATRRTEADMEPLRIGTWGTFDHEHRFMQLKAEALEYFRSAGFRGLGIATPR